MIRQIHPKDTKAMEKIAILESRIFPDPWSYQEVKRTVEQHHAFCGVFEQGDTLGGYFLCYYVLDECEIARIAVAEEVRRTGIGQKLFEHVEEFCREKALNKILLDVRESNEKAILFYKKNGFVVDGKRKRYYGGKNPEDAILMSKVFTNQMEDFV